MYKEHTQRSQCHSTKEKIAFFFLIYITIQITWKFNTMKVLIGEKYGNMKLSHAEVLLEEGGPLVERSRKDYILFINKL